jgi:hypothetical protein
MKNLMLHTFSSNPLSADIILYLYHDRVPKSVYFPKIEIQKEMNSIQPKIHKKILIKGFDHLPFN